MSRYRTSAAAVSAPAENPAQAFSRNIGIAIIGLLCTLIATGVISTVSLSIKVATVAESSRATSDALTRHLDHSVDKDDYVRRDASIQNQLNRAATKDELRDMQHQLDIQQHQLDTQTEILKDLQVFMSHGRRGRY